METRLHIARGAARLCGLRGTACRARPSRLRAGRRAAATDAARRVARRSRRHEGAAALARSVRSAASAGRGPHAAGRARRPTAGGGAQAVELAQTRFGLARGADRRPQPAGGARPRLLGYMGRVANAYHSRRITVETGRSRCASRSSDGAFERVDGATTNHGNTETLSLGNPKSWSFRFRAYV